MKRLLLALPPILVTTAVAGGVLGILRADVVLAVILGTMFLVWGVMVHSVMVHSVRRNVCGPAAKRLALPDPAQPEATQSAREQEWRRAA